MAPLVLIALALFVLSTLGCGSAAAPCEGAAGCERYPKRHLQRWVDVQA
jgi:hypothetical protein